MDERQLAATAVESLRAGVAVLDRDGAIRWVNDAWHRAVANVPLLSGATIGTRLADVTRGKGTAIGGTIAGAITSVVEGAVPYFEMECPADGGRVTVRLSVTEQREQRGAVVMCAEPGGAFVSQPIVLHVDAAQLAERLTPRERDVLVRLADGLDNRSIAKDLGVEYSTVRGYVRSLIEKLGARSRVDVVGIAYRTGLVRRTEVEA
ncbi:MAG: hypothetical protein QOH08_597 [Chloroflexota bacterium]|nr:hypothetical protein [Chloroflexota bacterium]